MQVELRIQDPVSTKTAVRVMHVKYMTWHQNPPVGYTGSYKIPEGSELANMFTNDAEMVAKVAKLAANLVAKNDANLALLPRFRQVLIELPL
ncbi:hypothetical protein TNCV_1627071 [Trichonephila clavipes]|nr:hypothetical protein TNCV_1627071 [Trichonephila clavipes]